MVIGQFLDHATRVLATAGIASARLDTLILLEDACHKDRSWLLAHTEQALTAPQLGRLNAWLLRRAKREPLAYIRGKSEFYGHHFLVSPDVLIPRPETEVLVDMVKSLLPAGHPARILEVGTGSGALAITIALERPHTQVEASDISPQALAIAKKNNRAYGNVVTRLFKSDLLEKASQYDLIAANLPYVSRTWECSPETNYEPGIALFADSEGTGLIKGLLTQASRYLHKKGYLVLEADPRSHVAVRSFAKTNGFIPVGHQAFIMGFQKEDERD